jgi:iron complex outermembrane receptor protein
LQNGVGTTDVANQSPDHAEGVDVSMAERIEIVRGPASLLYASGAIGSVVNVIDAKIPERVPESLEVFVEQTRDSSNSENRSVLRLDAGSGNFAFHIEGFGRSNENVEVPRLAIDERATHALEELQHAHDDEEEHKEEEEELENTRGFIGNSDAEFSGGAFGLSFVGESGFVGFSVSKLKNQ